MRQIETTNDVFAPRSIEIGSLSNVPFAFFFLMILVRINSFYHTSIG